jgi:hypothetical protein
LSVRRGLKKCLMPDQKETPAARMLEKKPVSETSYMEQAERDDEQGHEEVQEGEEHQL